MFRCIVPISSPAVKALYLPYGCDSIVVEECPHVADPLQAERQQSHRKLYPTQAAHREALSFNSGGFGTGGAVGTQSTMPSCWTHSHVFSDYLRSVNFRRSGFTVFLRQPPHLPAISGSAHPLGLWARVGGQEQPQPALEELLVAQLRVVTADERETLLHVALRVRVGERKEGRRQVHVPHAMRLMVGTTSR